MNEMNELQPNLGCRMQTVSRTSFQLRSHESSFPDAGVLETMVGIYINRVIHMNTLRAQGISVAAFAIHPYFHGLQISKTVEHKEDPNGQLGGKGSHETYGQTTASTQRSCAFIIVPSRETSASYEGTVQVTASVSPHGQMECTLSKKNVLW